MPALNARPAEQLDEWLAEITEGLAAHWTRPTPTRPAAPYAINQIVHKSNDRLEHDMAVCAKYKVPIVITSLGAREDINAGRARLGRRGAARHHQQRLRARRPSRRAPTA
jgi:nitronate monooxygenase